MGFHAVLGVPWGIVCRNKASVPNIPLEQLKPWDQAFSLGLTNDEAAQQPINL